MMRGRATNQEWWATWTLVLAAALCLAALFLAPSADAAYEQLPDTEGIFGGTAAQTPGDNFSEEVQLGGANAIAVNRTGAGGVKKGTVYVVTHGPQPLMTPRVAMFEPKSGGGDLEFATGWEPTELEEPYERCGPLLGTTEVDGEEVVDHPCPTRVASAGWPLGIGVDQSTGLVFVFGAFPAGIPGPFRPGTDQIVVYSADGSEVITRFAEQAPVGTNVADGPGKVHEPQTSGVLAVKGAGEVYVYDEVRAASATPYHRLMVFRPHNGDRSDYEYVGEIAAGQDQNRIPRSPTFDDAGNLYVAGIGRGGDQIRQLAPETPGPYPNPAVPDACEYEYPPGGMKSMTVDPATGEPFFFSDQNPVRIRRLGACDKTTHKFAGAASPETIALLPRPEQVYAMAVDPSRQASAARPSGQLYAASPGPTLKEYEEGGHSALGYIFAHPAELSPEVKAQSIARVTATSAIARASINPSGFRTTYAFQYVTEDEYLANGFVGAVEAPVGGSFIEGSGGVQSVTAALGQLLPGTSYRFRVVISSACKGEGQPPCSVEGGAAKFRTYPMGLDILPDGRAWELVSPAQKNGGQVLPADPSASSCLGIGCKPGGTYSHFPMQSSTDGEAIAYEGTNFGIGGPAVENEYLARRTPNGWQSTDLSPALLAKSFGHKGITQSLTRAVIQQAGGVPALAPTAPEGYANLYTQATSDPLALTPLVTAQPPNRGPIEFELRYADASSDGARIFFAANDALTPEAEAVAKGEFNLYEWSGGELSSVNVLPGGAGSPGASFGTASANTVSDDGTRAVWSDAAGQVYVRVGGDKTLEIPEPSGFLSASSDGSRILLRNGHLYALAEAGQPAESYVKAVDLSEGKGGFQGVAGQSEDLSRIYFVDTAELGEPGQENDEGETALAGANNLYAWQGGSVARFVARLAATDNENESSALPIPTDWATVPANRTATASPSGRYLAFLSTRELTGRNSVGPCERISGTDSFNQVPCQEAFVYDSQTESLACASCNPSFAAPLGLTVLRRIMRAPFAPQPRYLTDSGRLYFDTRDSLSPRDTNGKTEDVYEWEPEGVGSCAVAFAEGGCVNLLSAGRQGVDSNFVAADASGANVFFTTRDRLVGADTDELFDLYVAREGGGLNEEQPPAQCQGEACQAGSTVPIEASPASSAVQGGGNQKPSKCAKGKVKRGGKCVVKKQHKKRKHQQRKGAGR